ncbi:MAG: DoxX family protein [Candidatus Eisenbacteria bacterium]|uniref:DoxX family protein n=1 Tax=Eiseniibacteriota bacterium TaxID=2212470 RepID=A0A849SB89_UNCEI|nr:DoxX family protein [Candidatus Eisenbacteria bacterium]
MKPNPPAARRQPTSRALSIGLWSAQVLLAALFAISGTIKSMQSIELLHKAIRWTPSVPDALIRFIGIAELAGALGLLLPAFTRIAPRLTPVAATGLGVIMLFAAAFHISRGETAVLPFNTGLFALAAFVAWGRFVAAPIPPRA